MVAETNRQLSALYGELMEPLPSAAHDANRLIIAPQGMLHLVPFHALHDGAGWRASRQETQYVPSASLLTHLRSRTRAVSGSRPLVVAGHAEGLPGVNREAARAASQLGSNALLLEGGNATVAAVKAAASGADIIHLCGHGRFMPAHVGASGIRLTDRWLSLHDVHAMRLSASLVILSACESGPIRAGGGDEPTGLFHGFLSAGASGILASLWRVSDETAHFLLEAFHHYAQNGGGDYVAALRQAQMETMERRPHPAHWAPFMFSGVNE